MFEMAIKFIITHFNKYKSRDSLVSCPKNPLLIFLAHNPKSFKKSSSLLENPSISMCPGHSI